MIMEGPQVLDWFNKVLHNSTKWFGILLPLFHSFAMNDFRHNKLIPAYNFLLPINMVAEVERSKSICIREVWFV
jgi:hypothetical protein